MRNQPAGNVFLITAPSGAGKSSLVNALLENDAGLQLSVSCTTRPPRDGEVDGRDYYFVTPEQFNAMRGSNELLEWAQVHDNFYGTPRAPLTKALELGRDVLLEIDWQGAEQVRHMLPGVTGIFILPPSLDALESRLRARGKDSEEVIAKRMAAASSEIAHAHEFEYVIINQEFSVALQQLEQIVSSARLRYTRQAVMNPALFESFGLPR
ncbi:MAG: guanylate kinase [Burkholderiaceae bacterium]|nr:guanylate kinase [Burkholderiaceae bacterium]MCD8516277.1 guanylate kinase [Burkholderiaceae bacterium]MCD8536686.1 guanylate kinase [Burkholderiaceae bacterium]MCD8566318.1 guanylate kinase [Burkholderiaceae bacterium]